ncbi:hypothetical protein SBOR_7803 [Sclerotinia borealis F-4128]|uniref:Ribosomal protein S21 n=1 Tax=Sclerotinia borealis (strain F-4128) TaxID=1432307 RepID=W9C7S3_SCLBF|nr:hypothetical protein SBOR_7803 [Sclerotinia borealis F-4128]
MELRNIGTTAYRSSMRDFPFAQLLQSHKQTITTRIPISHRALSTTSRTYAILPQPTTRTQFAQNSPSSSSSPSPSSPETPNLFKPSSRTPPAPKEDTLESIGSGSISQSLSWMLPNRTARSNYTPSRAQMENATTPPISNASATSSPQLSSSALLNQISNPSSSYPSSRNRYSPMQNPFGNMIIPNKKSTSTSFSELQEEVAAALPYNPPPRAPMRLTPRTGRTVDINSSNVDLSRGIRMLEASCAINKVRHDHTHQRFYERAGMKRKRLHRQRWRNNFLEGFKGIVGRVKQLKNQGW